MSSRHKRTLVKVFTDSVSGTIDWSDIEALFIAVGCRTIEGSGSRVRFAFNGRIGSFHRPHPAKEAKRYQVRDARKFSNEDRSDPVNIMNYKGYSARIDFDADDGLFVGHLAGINDVIGFHGDTVAGLVSAFHEAVDDYLATCMRLNKPAEKPYSGKMMLRVRPEVHAKAALASQLAGKSMNQWGEEALEKAASSA